MAQVKTFEWTNDNPAAVRNLDVGFEVTQITTIDKTNGGSWKWVYGMADGSYLDVDAGTITGTNGFTPLAEDALYGPVITNMTNANPCVITVENLAQFDWIEAGVHIRATGVADDGSSSSLNVEFEIDSISGNDLTTTRNTSGASAYVSGGVVVPAPAFNPQPTFNYAIHGIKLGSGVVGAASAEMVAICEGQNPVT